jgi:uncharacterized membrane protein YqaE (UPF0057 family)
MGQSAEWFIRTHAEALWKGVATTHGQSAFCLLSANRIWEGSCVGLCPSIGHHTDVIRILLSILLPPLGVFLQVGIGLHFWLNILLTLLGYFPGLIHAIWVILRK